MKILPLENRCVVMRLEYFCPYQPGRGYYTFVIIGQSAEECIAELCKSKRINMGHITQKTILVDHIDTISTGLAHYCCQKYQDEYNYKMQQEQLKMQKYIEQQKQKPENSKYDNTSDMSFTPL